MWSDSPRTDAAQPDGDRHDAPAGAVDGARQPGSPGVPLALTLTLASAASAPLTTRSSAATPAPVVDPAAVDPAAKRGTAAAAVDAVIRVRGLTTSFGTVSVLDGVDLDVAAGSVHALLGPNGAGKTTLVRILATLLRADAGTALVGGHDVARAPRRVREIISLTSQYAAVDELLTGEENMLLAARLFRLPRPLARARTAELLARFDLTDAGRRLARTYSGGMRRRLDLAVGLISDPSVIFLDEPTTGLDPRSRQAVWDAVRTLADDGTTILLTTQYLEEADQLADRISVLDGGRIIAEGTAEELKSRLGRERAELIFTDGETFARAVAALDTPGSRAAVTAAAGSTAPLDGTSSPPTSIPTPIPTPRPTATPAPRAGAAATAVPGLDGIEVDRAARTIGVATDGTAAAVRRLLTELDHRGIEVGRVELRRPTLDDVFLTLTGHRAQPAANGDPDAASTATSATSTATTATPSETTAAGAAGKDNR
jgi:ABC-2 type transport system ATP-binding protein